MTRLIFMILPVMAFASPMVSNAVILIDALSPESNRYAHERIVRWPSSVLPAAVTADCSAFLNALVMKTYQLPEERLDRMFGRSRPKARDWHSAIVRGRYFRQITNVNDCIPGDVIAIAYPRGTVSKYGDTNTGHVMLLSAAPERIAARTPRVAGAEQYAARVIDSSESPHGADDTRTRDRSADTYRGGVGEGTIRLYTSNGNIIGYAWSMKSTVWVSGEERPIACGRLITNGMRTGMAP